jgi:hypothetical protein
MPRCSRNAPIEKRKKTSSGCFPRAAPWFDRRRPKASLDIIGNSSINDEFIFRCEKAAQEIVERGSGPDRDLGLFGSEAAEGG